MAGASTLVGRAKVHRTSGHNSRGRAPTGARVLAQASATGVTGAAAAPPPSRQGRQGTGKQGGKDALIRVVPEGTTSSLPLPPGPPFLLPIIGETPEYAKEGSLRFSLARTAKYGPMFRTSIYGMDLYMVTAPDLFRAIMEQDTKLVNFDLGGAFAKLQGEFNMGVLTNKDASRMPFRRMLLGSVTNDAMAGYVPKMVSITEAAVAELQAMPQGWDVSIEARKWGMAFANSLLAGLHTRGPQDEAKLRDDIGVFFDGLITFDIDLPGTPLRKALDARDRLLARIRESVQEQVDEILADAPVAPGVKIRRNMMGYVVDFRRAEGLDVDAAALAEVALAVLQAGTDTSSGGLAGVFTILAQRPDLMERLREEQRQVIAAHGPGISKASLDASKLLDACVREALRFVPPGLGQYRRVTKEFELAGRYRLPAGSWIMLHALTASALEAEPGWLDHAKAELAAGRPLPIPDCSNPLKVAEGFSPERFLVDPAARPTLFTFGFGPHTCVGMGLFIQEAKVMLAHVLRHAEIRIASDNLSWVEIPMVKPAAGVMLRLEPLAEPLV